MLKILYLNTTILSNWQAKAGDLGHNAEKFAGASDTMGISFLYWLPCKRVVYLAKSTEWKVSAFLAFGSVGNKGCKQSLLPIWVA
jgi:hypothetical protein